MKFFWWLSAYLSLVLLMCYGCTSTSHSNHYQELLDRKLSKESLGKAKFLYGDMGGIYPHTLKTNGFVYKVAVIALSSLEDPLQIKKDISLFTKYGFVFPDTLRNYKEGKIITDRPTGLISGKLSGLHPLHGKYIIETADLGCGSCHGSLLYGKEGNITNSFFLGMPNTSLNLEAFANDLFQGYKHISTWSEKKFEQNILIAFPEISNPEMNGLNIIFKKLKKEVQKIIATRGTVSTYRIGGAGTMNGIGAIKNGVGLLDNSVFNENEISLISIPTLAGRSFRSSLLVSGNYTPNDSEFFYEITQRDTSKLHDEKLATIISLFTIGTMGFNDRMAEKAIPDIKDVMVFISNLETPAFPGEINQKKALIGKNVYNEHCQSCHGTYEETEGRNHLVSYPNKYISQHAIKTDSIRSRAISEQDLKVLDKIALGKYFKAKVNKGYVAPILLGVWATAPYFHNSSVPTLWHLMHPEERPAKFYSGGHRLDYTKVGIRGELHQGIYQFEKDYIPWAGYEVFDTHQPGKSNGGHLFPFDKMTEEEKDVLLEYLKTL